MLTLNTRKHVIKSGLKRLVGWLILGGFFASLTLVLSQEYPVPGELSTRIGRAAGNQSFDFIEWTLGAWVEKSAQIAVPVQNYLTADQQRAFVLDFMQRLKTYRELEGQVRQIYIENTQDPAAASATLRARRDVVRADLEQRRPTAEAILQQQISVILLEEGFGVSGEVFPPVAARITPLPYILIVSPRDRISRVDGLGLQTGLNVDQAEAIETRVLSETNHAALVVPIGGLADYPSMILESTQLLWLLQTIAHEWSHHWLFLRPLGYNYLDDHAPQARIINETVASIVGDEIGLKVMRRFYLEELQRTAPELVEPKPLTIPEPIAPTAPRTSPDPAEFSFSRTMQETRVRVDELLAQAGELQAQGKTVEAERTIEEAEKYMEERRRYINANGYGVRKINQAYFAFYGAYADQPGASGSDPIGPTVIALRVHAVSVRQFMDRVSAVLNLDQLKQAVTEFSAAP